MRDIQHSDETNLASDTAPSVAPKVSPSSMARRGAVEILPLAFGAAIYGFAFGILAAQGGFAWWGVAAMSVSVHAGSSQIAAVEQFVSGAGLLGAALAGAALNLRYIGIVASLSEVLGAVPRWVRLVAIHLTGDENWALTMSRRAGDPTVGAWFLIGSGAVMITVWTLSTTVGAIVGASLPDLEKFGLGFAFTAAFIAMARSMWTGRKCLPSWLLAFLGTGALVILGVPKAYAIVGGTLVGLACLLLQPKRWAMRRGGRS